MKSTFMEEYCRKAEEQLAQSRSSVCDFSHFTDSEAIHDLEYRVTHDTRTREEFLRYRDEMISKLLNDPDVSIVAVDLSEPAVSRYKDEDGKWHSGD